MRVARVEAVRREDRLIAVGAGVSDGSGGSATGMNSWVGEPSKGGGYGGGMFLKRRKELDFYT